ncbi:MAG: hypothetical protein ACOCNH_06355, partial [Bacteroidales bacterium]
MKFDSFATVVNSTTVAKLSILYYKEKHIVTKLISQPPCHNYHELPSDFQADIFYFLGTIFSFLLDIFHY